MIITASSGCIQRPPLSTDVNIIHQWLFRNDYLYLITCGFLHLFPSKKGTNQWRHICINIHSTEARGLRRSSLDNGAFGLPARSACKDVRLLCKLTICFLPPIIDKRTWVPITCRWGRHHSIEILIRSTILPISFTFLCDNSVLFQLFVLLPKKDGRTLCRMWCMAANGELVCCKRSVAECWPAATSIWAEEDLSEESTPPRLSRRWRREYHSLLVSCKGNYCWLKLLNICLLAPQSTL